MRSVPPALALLEHALILAHEAVDDGNLIAVNHPAAVDLCAIMAATDRLLRRYLEHLDEQRSNIDS